MTILFVVLSLALYVFSPHSYSYGYCQMIHGLFLLNAAYVLIADHKNERVGFNLLFTLGMYFTNFVFPTFVYPVDPQFSLFSFPYNESVITRCTALAELSYACYGMGLLLTRHNRYAMTVNVQALAESYFLPSQVVKHLLIFSGVMFCLFIAGGGLDYFEDRYVRGVMSRNLFVQYMMLVMPALAMVLASLLILVKSNILRKYLYAMLLTFTSVLLLSGTRTLPLAILVALFVIYCWKNKSSYGFILSCVFIGIMLMSFIGATREDSVLGFDSFTSADTQIGWLSNVSDLFINNRNLYVAYDSVEKDGLTWGMSMLSSVLSPFPFAQTIFNYITGVPTYVLDSATYFTFLQFGVNAPLGLGTNLVADMYLAFGSAGVAVMSLGLGWAISLLRKKIYVGSYYAFLIYLILTADTIYMCRSTYFGSMRSIIWGLVIGWLILHNRRKPAIS